MLFYYNLLLFDILSFYISMAVLVDYGSEPELVTRGCYNHGERVLDPAGVTAAVVNSRSWHTVAAMPQSRQA